MILIIKDKIKDSKYVKEDVLFINLISLTNDTLTTVKSDLYYDVRSKQLNRRVRNKLSGHIISSTQNDLPIAPNFFLKAKGPSGTAVIAKRQACYDGALEARGMHSLQSYGQDKQLTITRLTRLRLSITAALTYFRYTPTTLLSQSVLKISLNIA